MDERMLSLARANENVVLEGRLTGAMMKGRKVEVFAVFVTADERVRAERIARRESKNVDSVLREMQVRERSEKKRYLAYYGINPYDKSIYDLWVDSTDITAAKAAEIIVSKLRTVLANDARQVKEGQ